MNRKTVTKHKTRRRKAEFGGLSRLAAGDWADKSSSGVLTAESYQKAVDYLLSPEYQALEMEKMRFRTMGEIIVGRALSMGLISEGEYARLMFTIGINGGLIISPTMYKKILPAVETVEKEYGERHD